MRNAYKEAGVDVEAGYEAVERMKKHVERTARTGVLGAVGGFGGMFDLSEWKRFEEPVLVSGCDGVGTKLKLAFELDLHSTIGVDVVGMCVNDVLAQGAEPLFFLDYIATGKNDPSQIEAIVKGVADGCVEANCALVGGETAEMPDMYQDGEYDIAGFTVGIAEKSQLIEKENVAVGDVLVGLPSSGVHSNGFSLVRKIVRDKQLDLGGVYPGLDRPLGEVLLKPTRIYVKSVLPLIERGLVQGISHITGGGFYENIPRMLPDGLGVRVDRGSWKVPQVFTFLQQEGSLSDEEMFGVFNMGIGMLLAVRSSDVSEVLELVEDAVVIGQVIGEKGVKLEG
ncbi:phosphoribosylformylglycinamidine cyclo-ligase [Bacillaceae bacterium S4-13-58]